MKDADPANPHPSSFGRQPGGFVPHRRSINIHRFDVGTAQHGARPLAVAGDAQIDGGIQKMPCSLSWLLRRPFFILKQACRFTVGLVKQRAPWL